MQCLHDWGWETFDKCTLCRTWYTGNIYNFIVEISNVSSSLMWWTSKIGSLILLQVKVKRRGDDRKYVAKVCAYMNIDGILSSSLSFSSYKITMKFYLVFSMWGCFIIAFLHSKIWHEWLTNLWVKGHENHQSLYVASLPRFCTLHFKYSHLYGTLFWSRKEKYQ